MRIGIGTTTIDPSLTHGHIDGIGVYTRNLLAEYQRLNYQVIPVMFPSIRNLSVKPQLPQSLVFPYPYSIESLTALLTPLGAILNQNIAKKISIFHATDYRIPKFKKIPVVATLHDAIMLKHPEWSNRSARNIKNWMMKTSVKWAQHFITGAAAIIPELVEYWGVDENKIDVVHHGIDDCWLAAIPAAEKARVLEKYKLPANFLLFVGTLQPRKNIDRIIKAFKQLPFELQREHKLVLVGKNGWQTQELLEEIKQLSANNTGVWLEYVPFDDLRALYQSAKLFLFPSLHEGFGMPILEAFASKTPVITSNITSMPEVAGDAAYLIDPYNVEQLQQAMYTLLSDTNLCLRYIQKGLNRVTQFSWKASAEKTLAIYQKLLS